MITILYNLTFSIKSCFSQTDSGKPFKLKFPLVPYTPPSGFKICKGSCKPKFMRTQRFQVAEAGGEIRALSDPSSPFIKHSLCMKVNSAHKEHGRGKKKGSMWLTTYKKTVIQKGMRKISQIQTFS